MDFARRSVEWGPIGNDKVIAERSAEYKVANQLLSDGSQLEDLRFTPPLFMWPDEGPDTAPPPQKPW